MGRVKVKTVLGDMSKLLILFKHFNMVLLLSVENWCPAKKAVCGKTPLVVRNVIPLVRLDILGLFEKYFVLVKTLRLSC